MHKLKWYTVLYCINIWNTINSVKYVEMYFRSVVTQVVKCIGYSVQIEICSSRYFVHEVWNMKQLLWYISDGVFALKYYQYTYHLCQNSPVLITQNEWCTCARIYQTSCTYYSRVFMRTSDNNLKVCSTLSKDTCKLANS